MTLAEKRELLERLRAMETNGGFEGAISEIVRKVLEQVGPELTEHATNVAALMEGARLDPAKEPRS